MFVTIFPEQSPVSAEAWTDAFHQGGAGPAVGSCVASVPEDCALSPHADAHSLSVQSASPRNVF